MAATRASSVVLTDPSVRFCALAQAPRLAVTVPCPSVWSWPTESSMSRSQSAVAITGDEPPKVTRMMRRLRVPAAMALLLLADDGVHCVTHDRQVAEHRGGR